MIQNLIPLHIKTRLTTTQHYPDPQIVAQPFSEAYVLMPLKILLAYQFAHLIPQHFDIALGEKYLLDLKRTSIKSRHPKHTKTAQCIRRQEEMKVILLAILRKYVRRLASRKSATQGNDLP